MKRTLAAVVLLALVAVTGRAQEVDPLVEALSSDSSAKVRAQAALALGTRVDLPAAVPALVAALGDGSPMVRGAAARGLGMLAAPAAYLPLAGASRDRDPFVAKWALWALKAVLAAAPVVNVGVRGLVASGPFRQDDCTKEFQAAILESLLATKRFDVGSTIEFRDDFVAGGAAGVAVAFEGEVASLTGDRDAASATVVVRVVAPGGAVAFTGRATASGKGGAAPPPGPDDDEYTIREEGKDARLVAVSEAGKAVAQQFLAAFQPPVSGRTR